MTVVKNIKDTEKSAIKRKLKYGDYKNCLEAIQVDNKMNLGKSRKK